MGVWEQINYLTGQTLKTLEDQQPFEILEISNGELLIFIYASLDKRKIKRERIELAWHELLVEGVITESSIKEKYSSGNAAQIAAILAEMPGVAFKTGPVQLSVSAKKKPDEYDDF